ncbi:hypothetical protein K491DRAFT_673801 [Lophiostoma macrostomum CBS 122681]|uniref:C2H2-type domain-containing protein n=1 Tax=Lophiostoma macrostomum CBS 122681 TaxID=1314788 RepID=A0A6A6TQM8_9PLEO|nr:hypothetical protein K491DRAFT_673801 [Lophiostoma macrostomum CBS 122681]
MCKLYLHLCCCGHSEISVPPCGEDLILNAEAFVGRRSVYRFRTCGRVTQIEERVHRDCDRCDPEQQQRRMEQDLGLMEIILAVIEDIPAGLLEVGYSSDSGSSDEDDDSSESESSDEDSSSESGSPRGALPAHRISEHTPRTVEYACKQSDCTASLPDVYAFITHMRQAHGIEPPAVSASPFSLSLSASDAPVILTFTTSPNPGRLSPELNVVALIGYPLVDTSQHGLAYYQGNK